MSTQQEYKTLITEFLAQGGRIRTIPYTQPKSVQEVVEYLNKANVPVQPVSARGRREPRAYLCSGKIMNVERLVAFANDHRRQRRLPPFELKGWFSH